MCVYSMIIDYYYDKWNYIYQPFPIINPNPLVPYPIPQVPTITEEELKEFRDLLKRAREYDKKHNQKDCELEEKKDKLRKLAKELGVDITFEDKDEQ